MVYIEAEVIFLNISEKFENCLNEKKYNKSLLASELGFTKQRLDYHLKNLKKGKLTFKIETIRKINEILNFDFLNFF